MTSVETTIQSIQDGMKKINDGMKIFNIGIGQMKQISFMDIVKEQKLDNFKLDEDAEEDMTGKQVKAYYEGKIDKYDEKVHACEYEKKQLESFFQCADNTRKQLEEILASRESINGAYDVNINNIKIVINAIIDYVNPLRRKEGPMEKLPLLFNEHANPVDARLQKVNKYVFNNMNKLEEWSGKKYSSVLYDSDIDGKDSSIFRNKILNHNQLCFIAIDSNDNVFGHYHPGVIDKINNHIYDNNIFIFTLNSNGRSGIKKFNNKDGYTYTWICNNNNYYGCGYGGYYIYQIDTNHSYIDDRIVKHFEGIKTTTLTGNCKPDEFTTKRVIVIEMK